MIDERAVRAQLDEVLDPELDQSLTALGFIHEVEIHGSAVDVSFRLPTFWCAPNFAYMMAADVRERVARVPGVSRVTVRLDDHFASDEINEGISAGRSFGEVFPDDAEAELDELRRTFARKAFLIRQEQLMRALLRAGYAPEHLARMTVADLRADGDDVLMRAEPSPEPSVEVAAEGTGAWRRLPGLGPALALYHKKRAVAGFPRGADEPLFTTADGDPLPPDRVMEHLRASRMVRLNGAFNSMLCVGLHEVRYGSDSPAAQDRLDAHAAQAAGTAREREETVKGVSQR